MAIKTEKKLTPEQRKAERIRAYRLKMGQHKLKNRSSKNILSISNPRWDHYNIYRHMSRTQLEEWSKGGNFDAEMELNRRNKKAAKRAEKKGN